MDEAEPRPNTDMEQSSVCSPQSSKKNNCLLRTDLAWNRL